MFKYIWLPKTLLLLAVLSGASLTSSDPFNDYKDCPSHQRVAKPEELRAERGLKAGELRVAWNRMASLSPGFGGQPNEVFITVIVEGGGKVVVRQVAYGATFADIDGVPRGVDLEIAAALTRQAQVISDISRTRLMSTRTSTRDRPRIRDRDGDPVPPPFSLLPVPLNSVAAGYNLAYWIQNDNSLTWLDDTAADFMKLSLTSSENVPPTGSFKAVDVGRYMACAIQQSDDTVACWGDSGINWMPLTPPNDLGVVTTLAVGSYHACAVRQADDAAVCWGDNYYGQRPAPDGEFHAVTGGWGHSCGLQLDGKVACWGHNGYGQTDVPAALGPFRAIASGLYHNCAIRADNTVACWGRNNKVPTGLGSVTALSAGRAHTCALSSARIVCWGDNAFGQISQVPSGTWRDLAAGYVHTCGRRQDETVECWRPKDAAAPAMTSLSSGQDETCGLRQTDGFLQCWGDLFPLQWRVADGRGVYAVAFKAFFNASIAHCGIRSDNTLDCWGASSSQILTKLPANLGTVKAVSAYRHNACVIKTDDSLTCWGQNADGQATVPANLGSVKAVDIGNQHTCAIKADDSLACWGKNTHNKSTPPAGLGTVKAVGVGNNHTCVIKSNNKLQCWGQSGSVSGTPTGTVKMLAVAQGGSYSCAVKTDDSAACWGNSGICSTKPSCQPEKVPTNLGTVSAISAGPDHACAIRKTGGTVTCWGNDDNGETKGPKHP